MMMTGHLWNERNKSRFWVAVQDSSSDGDKDTSIIGGGGGCGDYVSSTSGEDDDSKASSDGKNHGYVGVKKKEDEAEENDEEGQIVGAIAIVPSEKRENEVSASIMECNVAPRYLVHH